MSCYSVPKRLLHIVFGGSAIWLGTTFCSPLAATDFETLPTSASAPDALADPDPTPLNSIVPPAFLEEVSYWDNGPVLEDEICNNDYACEEEVYDEFGWESDFAYDYADTQEPYARDAAKEAPTESGEPCVDDSWCDEYAYDGYESDARLDDESAAVENDDTDGLVETPGEYVYGTFEDGSNDSGYTHDYDEQMVADEISEYSTYEFEDEYGYEEVRAADSQEDSMDDNGIEETEDDTYVYDEENYEDYWYDEEYVHDYEDNNNEADVSFMEEQLEEVTSTTGNVVHEVSEEDDFSYEFEDYGMYYGYEENSTETAEEATADEQNIAEDAAPSDESEWEDYYYESEYQYHYESDSQPMTEEMAGDSDPVEGEASTEEAWADENNAYEYEYYDYEYDMENVNEPEAASEDTEDAVYDYIDPMDHYGYEYEVPSNWLEMEEEEEEPSEVTQDLFDWQANELLDGADCDLIQSMEQLSDQPASERRSCLNNYIEALGFEAIDFAYRYEDATDADLLNLSDDLPGAAAFLATYRLIEEGQIGMDDGVVLLEAALSDLSLDWIEDVGRMASPKEVVSGPHPVVDAMTAVASHSIASVTALATAISHGMANLPWSEVEDRLDEIRSAFRPIEVGDAVTY